MSGGAWKNLLFFGALIGAFLLIQLWSGRTASVPSAFAADMPLSAALERSGETGYPVFALVTADWCGPCQQYKRGALSDGAVNAALTQRTIPVYIDADREPKDLALLAEIGQPVHALPTTVLIRDGRVVGVVQGVQSRDAVLALVEAGDGS